MRVPVIDPTLVIQLYLVDSPNRIRGIHDRRGMRTVTQTDIVAQFMNGNRKFDSARSSRRNLTTVDVSVRERTLPKSEAPPVRLPIGTIHPHVLDAYRVRGLPSVVVKTTEVSEPSQSLIASLNAVRYVPVGGYTG